MKSVYDQVRDQVQFQVSDQSLNQAQFQVEWRVWGLIGDLMRREVFDQVEGEL